MSNCDTLPYLNIPSFQSTNLIIAAISTRIGGVSQHPYESLNLAYHVGDDPVSVNENRNRFCQTLDIDISSLVLAQQVHGEKVAVIDDSQAGFGAYDHKKAIPDTDAMITKSRNVSLAVLTADCIPVLIFDPVKNAIGIAHAGWRGLLKNIVFKTIIEMNRVFGTEPLDCLGALGPSIGPCCYTVGNDVINAFRRAKLLWEGEAPAKPFAEPQSHQKGRLDLQLIAKNQLLNSGVKEENISVQQICTACRNDLFYSYRAESGNTGRIISVIRLMYD